MSDFSVFHPSFLAPLLLAALGPWRSTACLAFSRNRSLNSQRGADNLGGFSQSCPFDQPGGHQSFYCLPGCLGLDGLIEDDRLDNPQA
jgi:hypothetical protein